MNYGKRGIAKKQENLNSSSTKTGKRIRFTVVKSIFFVILAVIIIGGATGIGAVQGIISSAPEISNLNLTEASSASATFIVDQDGNEIQKLTESMSNRIPVTMDNIPLNMQHAIVAIEDERFYQHNGVDARGIARAFFINITKGTLREGASTITQQLLKNSVFTNWTSESSYMEKIERKIQEQYLALQLEKSMSKEQILERYLNAINLGAGTYGVEAAAKQYFGKDAKDLTLSECAVIAGITQNPTQFNPIDHPDFNRERRQRVLDKMLNLDYIDQTDYDTAMADDVYSRIQTTNVERTASSNTYSYYTDELIEQVLDALTTQLGYTSTQAHRALYSGGLRIYSAQDTDIQDIVDEEFANPKNYPSTTQWYPDFRISIQKADGQTQHYSQETMLEYFEKEKDQKDFSLLFSTLDEGQEVVDEYKEAIIREGDTIIAEHLVFTPQPQASAVIMDQHTGFVKALVGGRGEKNANRTLNRATASLRQPGSVFKIISTYAPAIDSAGKTLGTVYDNAPFTYNNGTSVYNWEGVDSYTGLTTIRSSIAHSTNITAVKALSDIGVKRGWDYVQNFQFTTVGEEDQIQPLALGGISKGVYNSELTASFAAIANKGVYVKPIYFTKILNSDGDVLIDNTKNTLQTRVIKESTAFLLTDAMQDVVSYGTGSDLALGSMPVAGKTGTTSNYVDLWFTGYTPYYTASVWGGYDNSDPLPNGDTYHTYNRKLWSSIMGRIHKKLPVKSFDGPGKDIIEKKICSKSGKLAVEGVCEKDPRGDMTYTEYFVKGTEPKDYCDVHISVTICTESGQRATQYCPTTSEGIFFARPKNSEGKTDDSQYELPSGTCSLHNAFTYSTFENEKKEREKLKESEALETNEEVTNPEDNGSASPNPLPEDENDTGIIPMHP